MFAAASAVVISLAALAGPREPILGCRQQGGATSYKTEMAQADVVVIGRVWKIDGVHPLNAIPYYEYGKITLISEVTPKGRRPKLFWRMPYDYWEDDEWGSGSGYQPAERQYYLISVTAGRTRVWPKACVADWPDKVESRL